MHTFLEKVFQTNKNNQTINKILEDNEYETDTQYIWLADTYDTIPDSNPPHNVHGTQTLISRTWRSPFYRTYPPTSGKLYQKRAQSAQAHR
jgi:hypothetical protein